MTRPNLGLRWIKPAHQDRSRATHDRLTAAALRILTRGRSFDELTVAELVKEADASVGAFYNRFPDKLALLHWLQIGLYEEGDATARAALDPQRWIALPLEQLVHAFVALAVSSYHRQRGLRRALLVAMGTDPAFRERAAGLAQRTCEGLTAMMAARNPARSRAEIRGEVDVCHRIVYGVLDQDLLFTSGSPTGKHLSRASTVTMLTRACMAVLAAAS